ncbi:hypothetical protein [Bhargavaea beijingensis]|uniref:Uncharacterized protein n=1 Tax=Bhargavaea beijingensis TaxID=426756 RepID=A0A1G7F8W7_9BACL|nr:hypothetical protein [Bhargavaea beijingensis]MCW1927688.1 hypothetical protein [Bhargavaea beijingensis]SDE72347.1 hypothetical protein SAMN04488126_11745 [Bhargavaea beijingensis]
MKPISIQDILQLMERLDVLLAERERLIPARGSKTENALGQK